jgi:hypothetical protein
MKVFYSLLIILCATSCIPLRIAPNIKGDKIMVAKKFKRNLPRQHAFIFEDKPFADEFYNYINTKFQLEHQNVTSNVLVNINGSIYALSYYETEIPTKTLDLVPVAVDAKRESNGNDPLFENQYVSRKDQWYIVITLFDEQMKNCLNPKHKQFNDVNTYLKSLREEYKTTSNYMEVVFKKKS